MSDGLISSRMVKTRKPHKCFGCARPMPTGTEMECVNWKCWSSGKIDVFYYCQTCQAYMIKYMNHDDEFMFGDLRSEGGEQWESLRRATEATETVPH